MLTAATLVGLATACHLALPPETLAWRVKAHAAVESGGAEYAIKDNTAKRSYSPASKAAAIDIVTRLLAAHHSLDGGPMQVNSQHWSRLFGGDLSRLFDPQANVCAGLTIVAEDYDLERRVSCRYVSGKPDCPPSAAAYPDLIARAANREAAGPPPPPHHYGDDQSALAPVVDFGGGE